MYFIKVIDKENIPGEITKTSIKNAEYRYSASVKKADNISDMVKNMQRLFPERGVTVFQDTLPIRFILNKEEIEL